MLSIRQLLLSALPFASFSLVVSPLLWSSHAQGAFPGVVRLRLLPASGSELTCEKLTVADRCGLCFDPYATVQTEGALDIVYDAVLEIAYACEFGPWPDSSLSEMTFSIALNGRQGEGVDILDWSFCADTTITEPGWPDSGKAVTIQWKDANCLNLEPIALPYGGFGAVIGVFRLRAYGQDFLRITGGSEGTIELRTCDGRSLLASINSSTSGELGFGGPTGWDPCLWWATQHGCFAHIGSSCICCLPDHSCRGIAPYWDWRTCVHAGGEFIGVSSCNACSVPVVPTTWSSLKTRFLE